MTPVARLKGDPLTRYELDANGCWIWQGASHSAGYGMLWSEDRKQVYAHRFFYEQHVGPIPDGLVIDHLCRVPACVNPAHLEPVTHLENCQRGVQPSSLRTHCVEGHPFTCEATLRGYYSDDDVHSWGVTTGASSFGGWGASGHYSDGSAYVWGSFNYSYGKVVAYKGRCSGGDYASDWFVGF
jgi:hypothetical protein